jgi:uncharacterized protein with von Willebrand factor type A (vWA) domain
MKIKFCSLFAGAALLALAGAANAQPRALSEHQMDGLTAGAASTANAGGFAIGDFLTFTTTQTATNAVTSIANQTPAQIGIAFGGSFSAAAAASALFQAAVATHADSSATLP